MSELSDKLKALGVKVGAKDLPLPRPAFPFSIEKVLQGFSRTTSQGETFIVETYYPLGHLHGHAGLEINAPLSALASWAGNYRLVDLPPSAFAFIDTETTGLAGGTGTYAFLIGVGRFEGDHFHLSQIFMRDPIEEPAQLAVLEEFISACQSLVTFNGKAFDIPLLQTRFISHGWRAPFTNLIHVDLLQLARKLWRDRIPSRTLPNLEANILGVSRTEEDVPGWMIPSLYFAYLRDGDARPLKNVFYHNAMDVISLVTLFNHIANLVDNPFDLGSEHSVDLIALGRLFEKIGNPELASRLYLQSLDHEDIRTERLPRKILILTILRLAMIHKRQRNYAAAIELWEQAAQLLSLEAFLELAKYYEHHARDYQKALYWTQTAIDSIDSQDLNHAGKFALSLYERRLWLADLNHRLSRLSDKLSRTA